MAPFVSVQPVFAIDFIGSKVVSGGTYTYGGNKAMGMVFDAPGDVTINEMYAHVYAIGTATEIRGVIYKSNGNTWDLIATTDIAAISTGWNSLTFYSPIQLTSGGTYLLAHICDGSRILNYGGTGGGRVWNGSVDFHDPVNSGSQPFQLAYHYGAWAPYSSQTGTTTSTAGVGINLYDSLIAYFPFEGTADDVSGNDNHGAEVGFVSYEGGAVGQAATFDGQGFIVADGQPFTLSEWTISFWIYVEKAPPEYWYSPVSKQAVTDQGIAGNYNYAFTYWYNGWFDSQYEDCSGDNTDHMMHPGRPMSPGHWYHIVSTRDASGNYKIYLNGNLGSQTDGSDMPCTDNPDAPFLIGGKVTDMTYLFKGQIDELRVYGKAHDAGFIQELFNAPGYTANSSVNNPPVADAGTDIEIASENQVLTAIQGTASDSDGDTLNYRWLEGNTELSSWQSVGPSGEAILDLSTVSDFSIGSRPLTLQVDDGQTITSDTMILTFDNSVPQVAATGGGVYQIGDPVILSGQVSDYDGDFLNYQWLQGESLLFDGTIQSVQGGSPVTLPDYNLWGLDIGVHTFTLSVSDGVSPPVKSDVTATVTDTQAPTFAPVADKAILWPPNHKMVDVVIMANAIDNSGGAVQLAVTISSNESINGPGDGQTPSDWVVNSIDQTKGIIFLQLRAERSGKGNARIYTVTVTATDDSDNSSSTDVNILVPHDKGNKKKK